jgi:LytTr DNA-binding domain
MNLRQDQIQAFVKYQFLWGSLFLVAWFGINILVLASTQVMEFQRDGKTIPFWEPLSWEVSSAVMILLLIPLGIAIHDRWLVSRSFKQKIILHILLTLPFSLVHIIGMVAIRHAWYGLMNEQYFFGDWLTEFLYEYRKDAQTYLTVLIVVLGYRLIVRRLQGEASYIQEGEVQTEIETDPPKAERLLIKKLGREFLIQVQDIEWIEASGNYANLHIKGAIYPMRITMEKLEKLLPDNFVRIHRSTIVDMQQVKEVVPQDSGDYQIKLQQGTELTLSRRYRDSFKGRLVSG